MIDLNLSIVTRWGLNILALLGGVVALRLGQSIFIPMTIALLLAAMLWPFVRWLNQGLRLPWTWACFTVVLGLALVNVLLMFGLLLSIPRLLQGLPRPNDEGAQQQIYRQFRHRVEKMIAPVPLEKEGYFPEEAARNQTFQYVLQTITKYVPEALLEVGYYGNVLLWQWILIMFILLFLLIEGPMLTGRVVEIFGPSVEAQTHAVRALSEMALHVRNYLVWRTIINFGMALVVGVVYHFLELEHPWTWAILTAVFCYVPYLGPLAAGVGPVIDAFLTGSDPWLAIWIILFYLFVVTVEGYVVFPLVMGRTMELNATTVLLACLFWDLVWGTTGLFLAMPLMAAVKAICTYIPDGLPWANLMSIHKIELPSERRPAVAKDTADGTMIMSPEKSLKVDAAGTGRSEKNS